MVEALPLLLLVFLPFAEHPVLWVVLILLLLPGFYAIVHGPPFAPTPRRTLDAMFQLARVRPEDHVYDLGCGDGRIVFRGAALGAHTVGYELSIPLFLLAKSRSFFKGGTVRFGDFWRQDYRDADVIFCFLTQKIMETFHERIWPQLPRGCRVVSHAFTMPGMEPVEHVDDAYLYVKN